VLLLIGDTKPPKPPDLVKPAAHGLEHAFVTFWPLWLLIVIVALAKFAWHLYRLRRLSKSGITEIDRMDGRTFEVYLSTLFRRLGYGVEVTQYRGDYGADLVVTKDRHRTAVQAKRSGKRVGVKAVQEAVAAKGYYDCDEALVVANREFTQQARRLASKNNVELWDRDILVSKLLSARSVAAASEELSLNSATSAAPRFDAPAVRATCATCGVAVSEKVRDYCIAHSTRFDGRIYCFKHQRSVGAVPAAD